MEDAPPPRQPDPKESEELLGNRSSDSDFTGYRKQLANAERFAQACYGAFLTLVSVCLMVFSALLIVFVAHKTLQPVKRKV